jgi:RimJ/RimL family protein N-acetyltransferase
MATVRLLPATLEHLEAYAREPVELAMLLGSPIPDGWPEFPEAIPFTTERLRTHPDEAEWWMHFVLDDGSGALVGSGGFAGPPSDDTRGGGTVEIGLEIAPAFRGVGYGTAAMAALVAKASAAGVETVIGHTLAVESPSTGALKRVGFEFVEAFVDPDDGEVWLWRRQAPA